MQIRCCLFLPFHRFVAAVRFCLEVLSLFQDLLRYLFNSKNLSPVCSIYAQSQRMTKFHGVKSRSRISGRGRVPSGVTAGHEGWRVGSQGVLAIWQEREAVDRPCFRCALSPGRHRPPTSARAYRAASILATNSLAHLIASSTSWSTGRPSARAAYISSHPFCLAMAGGQACARL